MNEHVRRMMVGAVTGVIVPALLEAFRSRLAGVHAGWQMLLGGAAGWLVFAALERLFGRRVGDSGKEG